MKQYAVREAIPGDVSQTLNAYPELLRSLLYYRGIKTLEEAELFLNPSYENDLSDPFLMKDMDKSVERILRAISNNEHILIYSDYDADGIPAAVVLSDFFEAINYPHVEIYIPHRHKEGYGLHHEAILGFKDRVKLMITLDCGIVDHEEVAAANSFGIDVIVTDHHLPGEKLPEAYAILNSKQEDCTYPYKMLCGAGVGFKLVQALISRGTSKKTFEFKEGAEKWLLDMVGLATLSDMVPLQGENRVLAYYGMKVLRKSRRPGLLKLLRMLQINPMYLTEDDIGFMITPRINAASRMGIPTDAYRMLSTKDEAQAGALAKHLDEINQERKTLVSVLTRELHTIMEERLEHFQSKPIIVLGNPEWRPAILGLAANKLVEEYGKPVFLWGREDGVHIKGSCRSDGSVSVVEVMEQVPEAFEGFGGHKMSGGFSVHPDKIHHLEDALVKAFESSKAKNGNEHDKAEELSPIDSVLTLDDVSNKTYSSLEKMAPFGMDNPKPVFLFKNVRIEGLKMFGKRPEHLELTLQNEWGGSVKAIVFFMNPEDFDTKPEHGKDINLVATLEKSYFRGRPELRLRIVDII